MYGCDSNRALTSGLPHAICRSQWGRLRVTGEDRLKFLHSQSTADVATRQAGESFETVFTSPKVLARLLYTGQDTCCHLHLSPNCHQTRLLCCAHKGYDLFGCQELTSVCCCPLLFSCTRTWCPCEVSAPVQRGQWCLWLLQGRMYDLVTCVVQPSSVILLTSPNAADPLLEHLQHYILYGDRVSLGEHQLCGSSVHEKTCKQL